MHRIFLFLMLLLTASVGSAAQELPPRPSPFQFINDQAQLLSAAEAKTLEGGLRRYADNTGTQIVVVTVPTLDGRDVADYARQLGTAWGVGQRGQNNGLVLLVGAQERKVTIQAGSGLQQQITPALTARVIDEMTPSFKANRYFAGLRTGLNSLMLAANPSSNPNNNQPAGAAALPDQSSTTSPTDANYADQSATPMAGPEPIASPTPAAQPAPSSGLGFGTLAIGALLLGGVVWLISKLFRKRSAAAAPPVLNPYSGNRGPTPDFLPQQPNPAASRPMGQRPGPQQGPPQRGAAPDFLPGRNSGMMGGGGSGMGGILMTGAAAAAGAYLGNRMAHGHDTPDTSSLGSSAPTTPSPLDTTGAGAGLAGGAGVAAGGGFPALDGTEANNPPAPDYFSDEAANDNSPDYFSSDESSSYDDLSSDDTGGAGFDDTDDNSGSW